MGGKTSTSTSTVSIPKWVRDRYIAVNERAEAAASQPFQIYSNDPAAFVAQLNQQQQQGIQNVNAAAGAYQPYFEAATQAGVAGMGSAQPQDLNLEQFYNPFQQQVIDATMKQMAQANEQAQSGALGQAASSGAFGGDRAGIAAANLANQQGLSMGSTLAGLNAQNYNQALAAAQQQQQLYLGATQADLARLAQGGQFLAGLGTAAQQAGLAGAEAQINAGTLQQQTEQAGKNALYNQFQQQQAYPFQVAQFLANIAMGTGALSGSTTTTTQPSSWFSDRRLKEDIRRIGHTDDGLPIYKYKYKGDDNHQTHIGFMADEVEQVKPEAVGVSGGYKTVDYDRATKADGGGVAGPYGAQFGSQSPYAMGYVPQAILPVGQLMVADSNLLDQSDKTLAEQMQAASSFGESVRSLKKDYTDLRDWWKGVDNTTPADPTIKTWRGGVVGYATGGPAYLEKDPAMAQPVQAKSYLSDTVDSQEKKRPELQTASSAPQGRSTMDDIGSLASTAASIASIFAGSDRRMKHDIRRIGRTDHGLPIYSFKYKGDDREQTHIGFMADEVEKEHPGAVMTGHDGYKRVDYSQAHKFYQGGVVRPAMQVGGTPPEDTTNLTAAELMQAVANSQMPPTATARLNTPAGQPMPEVRPVRDDIPGSAGVVPAEDRAPVPAATERPARLSFPTGVAAAAPVAQSASPLTLGNAVPTMENPAVRPALPSGVSGDYRITPAAGEAPTGVVPSAPNTPTTPVGPNRTAPVDLGSPAAPAAPAAPSDTAGGVAGARVDGGAYDMDAARNFYRNNIIRQESGGRQFDANGNPLTSPAGAVGVGQVMEGTGPEAAALAGLPWDRDRWMNDPEYNAAIGEAYFLEQYRRFGSLDKAAAAYNAGPGALSSALDRATGLGGSYLDYLPEETQKYVAATTGMGGGVGRASVSASNQEGGDNYYGGVSPGWRERNALGRMMYDPRTNKFSGDALLAILSGLGTMASSPSRYLGSAILQGIGGAASTYAGLREQSADVAAKNMENMRKLAMDTIRWNEIHQTNLTPAEYAETLNLNIDVPGTATAQDIMNGAYTPTTDNGLRKLDLRTFQNGSVTIGGRTVRMQDDPASLRRFIQDNAIFRNDPDIGGYIAAAENRLNQIDASGGRTVDAQTGQEFQIPGYISVGDTQAKAEADRIQSAEFRGATQEVLDGAARQVAAVNQMKNVYSNMEAGSLAGAGAQASAFMAAIDPNNYTGWKSYDLTDPAQYQMAIKGTGEIMAARLAQLPGGAPAASIDFLQTVTPGPDMQPGAIKKLLAIAEAEARYKSDLYSGYDPATNGTDVTAYAKDFAENGERFQRYVDEAYERMPRFAGEPGSQQNPLPTWEGAEVGDYFMHNGQMQQRTE